MNIPELPKPQRAILIVSPTELIREKTSLAYMTLDMTAHTIAQQWSNLRNAISAAGAHAVVVKPDEASKSSIDLIGTAGFIFNGRFISTVHRSDETMGQEAFFVDWIKSKGFSIFALDVDRANKYFAGAVDIAVDENKHVAWYAHGVDSSREFLPTLCEFFDHTGYQLLPLKIVDTSFNSLDECLLPLQNGFVIWYREAFDAASQLAIEKAYGDRAIQISASAAKMKVCSAIVIGDFVVCSKNTELANQIEHAHLTPIQVETSTLTDERFGLKRLILDVIE